jgi:MarR family transcriptional regulator, 2-MHQ and catechol-resistance regulon repressor
MSTAAVTDRELSLKLWVVLARAYRAVARQLRRDIERHGLVVSEFGTLEVLYHKGDLPVGDVSERVLLTSGSMTHVVDKLERRGLLVRRRCPEDQRITYLAITPAGRALMAAMFPAHAEAIRRATAGLGPDEKRMLVSLLKRLGLAAADRLEEDPSGHAAGLTGSSSSSAGRGRN